MAVKQCMITYASESLLKPIKKGAEKKLTAEQARKELHTLVDSIPAKDLAKFVGAQVSINC